MRSGTGTKSGESFFVTRSTNATMAFFAAPSFHDCSGSSEGARCAAVADKTIATLETIQRAFFMTWPRDGEWDGGPSSGPGSSDASEDPSRRAASRAARRLLLLAPLNQPREDRLMPQPAVLWLQHPVVLVGEIQKPRRDALSLQRREHRQPLRVDHSVVERAVDHERRRLPVL